MHRADAVVRIKGLRPSEEFCDGTSVRYPGSAIGLRAGDGAVSWLFWLVGHWAEIRVSPAAVKLDRPEASQQLLITDVNGEKQRDATREAKFEVKPPVVVRVDADGLMEPLEEGTTTVVVKVGAAQVEIPVTVTGLKAPPPVSFEHEIQPILTKNRCNSGGCHGKAEGQNGFKLSLLGFRCSV